MYNVGVSRGYDIWAHKASLSEDFGSPRDPISVHRDRKSLMLGKSGTQALQAAIT